MKKFMIATGAAMLSLVAAMPASAADCAADYKSFFDQFNGGPAKSLTAAQLVLVNRQAIRGFDACSAGDEANSKAIFAKLREAAPAKGDDFWKSLGAAAPAKK